MSSNFSDTLTYTTLMRFGICSGKKFIFGFFIYWLFIQLTQNWLFNRIFGMSFDFFISDFIKIFVCFFMIDFAKGLVYVKYENNSSAISNLAKIALEPNVQTLFMFANTILISNIFYTLDNNASHFK
jgi:hypothetical protein